MEFLSMEEKRNELYFQQDDVKALVDTMKRLVAELHDQTQENLAEREQLDRILNK